MAPTARELVARIWDLRPGAILAAPRIPEVFEQARAVIAPDAEIVFATPDGGLLGEMGGPWQGPEGLRDAWMEWTSGYEEWVNYVDRVEDVDDARTLLLVKCTARLAGSTQPLEVRAAALYTAEDGRIVKIEHFLDQDQARRAAGLD